jgi:hypothetical protein
MVFMTAWNRKRVSRYYIHASIAFTEELNPRLAVLFSLSGARDCGKAGNHLVPFDPDLTACPQVIRGYLARRLIC